MSGCWDFFGSWDLDEETMFASAGSIVLDPDPSSLRRSFPPFEALAFAPETLGRVIQNVRRIFGTPNAQELRPSLPLWS